jgi:hypothetical protein
MANASVISKKHQENLKKHLQFPFESAKMSFAILFDPWKQGINRSRKEVPYHGKV